MKRIVIIGDSMKKIIAVGGRPGTGKTTLFREFIKQYEWDKVEPKKLVPALYNKELDLYILGKYEEGDTFAGTDKMSMACQPNVQEFIIETTSNVLYEGDRIFNKSFLEFASEQPNVDLSIIYLKVSDDTLQERYEERGSNQSETFLKGRETKYNNILSNFDLMSYITEFENSNTEQQTIILNFLKSKFGV
jgi:deoxyadenosine/deoxycytidine kinase